jgi:hypothetical protein
MLMTFTLFGYVIEAPPVPAGSFTGNPAVRDFSLLRTARWCFVEL